MQFGIAKNRFFFSIFPIWSCYFEGKKQKQKVGRRANRQRWRHQTARKAKTQLNESNNKIRKTDYLVRNIETIKIFIWWEIVGCTLVEIRKECDGNCEKEQEMPIVLRHFESVVSHTTGVLTHMENVMQIKLLNADEQRTRCSCHWHFYVPH